MVEYPKSLYLKGWEDLSKHVIVNSPDEEEKARKNGYKSLNEDVAPAPVKRTRAKKAE